LSTSRTIHMVPSLVDPPTPPITSDQQAHALLLVTPQ
jgi:hypothetical protein